MTTATITAARVGTRGARARARRPAAPRDRPRGGRGAAAERAVAADVGVGHVRVDGGRIRADGDVRLLRGDEPAGEHLERLVDGRRGVGAGGERGHRARRALRGVVPVRLDRIARAARAAARLSGGGEVVRVRVGVAEIDRVEARAGARARQRAHRERVEPLGLDVLSDHLDLLVGHGDRLRLALGGQRRVAAADEQRRGRGDHRDQDHGRDQHFDDREPQLRARATHAKFLRSAVAWSTIGRPEDPASGVFELVVSAAYA